MKGFLKAAALVLLLVLTSLPRAENFVAINSVDGRDVLSGIFYANVKGYTSRFMPVPGGDSGVFASKIGPDHSILLVQSSDNPVSGFAESDLKAKGNTVEVYSSSDGGATNLDLARRSGAGSFIIVDSAFAESAVSAITYAARTKSYVLLTDRTNVDQVKQIVSGKKVIIYGYADQQVKTALADTNPQFIGKGEDKYEDNIELVRKTMDEFSLDRPIITDGSMLEDSLSAGELPILLSARLVPQTTYDFIKQKVGEGKLTGVLLIGNDMVYPVYDMREKMKREFEASGQNKSFGVMVKFAQAIPSAQGGVMTLDTFRVPAYRPRLNITEIVYNKNSGKVMAGLENIGEGPLYFTLEMKVLVDGKEYKVFGQPEPRLIERGESAGVDFPLDLSGVPEGAVSANALVKYGAARKSLEEFATSEGKLASITYVDSSNVSVRFAKYDREKQRMLVTIKNNGEASAFVFIKLVLTDENGQPTKIAGPAIREVESSALFVEEFPLILSDKEIGLNKEVTVTVDYGGRRGFLSKNEIYKVPLEQEAAPAQMQLQILVIGAVAAIAVLAVILLYAVYIFVVRKKK